jgi:hypothetical protein
MGRDRQRLNANAVDDIMFAGAALRTAAEGRTGCLQSTPMQRGGTRTKLRDEPMARAAAAGLVSLRRNAH